MANRIEMSNATRKGIALAIGVLCVCVVGAMLAVGRGSGRVPAVPARAAVRPRWREGLRPTLRLCAAVATVQRRLARRRDVLMATRATSATRRLHQRRINRATTALALAAATATAVFGLAAAHTTRVSSDTSSGEGIVGKRQPRCDPVRRGRLLVALAHPVAVRPDAVVRAAGRALRRVVVASVLRDVRRDRGHEPGRGRLRRRDRPALGDRSGRGAGARRRVQPLPRRLRARRGQPGRGYRRAGGPAPAGGGRGCPAHRGGNRRARRSDRRAGARRSRLRPRLQARPGCDSPDAAVDPGGRLAARPGRPAPGDDSHPEGCRARSRRDREGVLGRPDRRAHPRVDRRERARQPRGRHRGRRGAPRAAGR